MSNLLEKASILTTPTAYNDGKLLSVKPNTSVGDFDFTRNSSATRVASNGLIEDVQILSGNLVTNGDFSQEGSELVTNGDFETDSNWSKGTGWSIGDSVATANNVPNLQRLQQGLGSSVVGKTYKYSFNISNVSGAYSVYIFGVYTLASISTEGLIEGYVTATSTNGAFWIAGATAGGLISATIDNVSVKEVGQDWNLGTDWSIGENKAIRIGSTSSAITQSGSFSIGKKFKLSFKVTDWTTGGLQGYFYGGGGGDVFFNLSGIGNGDFIFETTTTANRTNFAFYAYSSFNGSITNISVIEITDDTNLPRIDYTDGVGHILLEPQSTNLVTQSEDFSTYSVYTGASIEQNYSISPEGVQNSTKLNLSANAFSRIELVISGSFASQTHTVSVWARCASNTEEFRLKCTNRGYVDYYSENKTVTTQWQRFSFSATFGSSAGDIGAAISNSTDAQERSIEIFGFQLEADKSYATSYIPTSGSTVTRLGETLNNAGSSDLINSTEGVLYAEISALADDLTFRVLSLSDGTNNNTVKFGFRSDSNKIYAEVRSGSSSQAFLSYDVSDITDFNKVALKYKVNDFSFFVNGVKRATDPLGNTPIGLNTLNFNRGDINNKFYGNVKSVAVYKEALTDAELTCLTTI